MPKLVKTYLDFRGGLNVDTAPDNLADNELMQADNVDLDQRGAASKRKGTAPFNQTSYGAQVERLIEWPRNDGTKILLAIVGTTLAKIADDGTKTNLKTLDNADIGYFFHQDKFYFTGKASGADGYWFYDGTTVTAVTANSASDNDLAPIKRCRLFLWHPKSQRIFAAKDANDRAVLYYSETGDPTYFKNTSKLYPTTGDGPVYGLALFGEAMLTVYQGSEWSWKGVDPATDAEWSKLPSTYGTIAPHSIAMTPSSLTFLGQGGIISLSPGLIDYNIVLLTGNELITNRAKDKVASIIRSIVHPETACAVYDKLNERYLLAYGDDPGNSRNNKILVLDWGIQAFTRYTGLQVNDFCQRANGDLLAAANGYILKMGQGNQDWDIATAGYIPIPLDIKTKQYNLDYPIHLKKTYRLFLAARQYDVDSCTVNITVTAGSYSISFDSVSLDDSFLWGEPWGNVWGYSDLVTKELKCRLKGQRFQVQIQNALVEPATIYGLAFEYKVKRPRGSRV